MEITDPTIIMIILGICLGLFFLGLSLILEDRLDSQTKANTEEKK